MPRGGGLAEEPRAQTYFVAVERLGERDAEVAETLVSVFSRFGSVGWLVGGVGWGGVLTL